MDKSQTRMRIISAVLFSKADDTVFGPKTRLSQIAYSLLCSPRLRAAAAAEFRLDVVPGEQAARVLLRQGLHLRSGVDTITSEVQHRNNFRTKGIEGRKILLRELVILFRLEVIAWGRTTGSPRGPGISQTRISLVPAPRSHCQHSATVPAHTARIIGIMTLIPYFNDPWKFR